MKHREDQHVIDGPPELALILYAFLAAFVFLLSQATG